MLPRTIYEFVSGGAENEVTLAENSAAFTRIRLRAKAFAKANSFKGLETTVLGHKVSSPIGFAPTGL